MHDFTNQLKRIKIDETFLKNKMNSRNGLIRISEGYIQKINSNFIYKKMH
jgi:hypothetical protein